MHDKQKTVAKSSLQLCLDRPYIHRCLRFGVIDAFLGKVVEQLLLILKAKLTASITLLTKTI